VQGGNKNSGRRAVIDMRPDKQEIIKDIVLGRRTLTEIAKRIGVDYTTIQRYRDSKITEEMRRSIMAEQRIRQVEVETEVINQDRMDVATTYESLARRVEKLTTKAEANEDDAFALAAMEGLRKVLRDVAMMQGKLATALTVNVTLAEAKEWVTLRAILQEVCDEVPAAREPLLRRMRHHVLSVTKEDSGVGI
jgi:predicted site-specific integrase-resolvase